MPIAEVIFLALLKVTPKFKTKKKGSIIRKEIDINESRRYQSRNM